MDTSTKNVVAPIEPKKIEVKKIEVKEVKIKYYTIKKGDTVYSLAKNNGTTVEELLKLNGMKDFNIKIGQKIKIKTL